jgi:hypothetical protein
LFLFCVFLMFAIMGWTGGLQGPSSEHAKQSIAQELASDQQKLVRLQQERDAKVKAGKPLAGEDGNIAGLQAEIGALKIAQQRGFTVNTAEFNSNRKLPYWMKRLINKGAANPELLFYKIKTDAYKFSWALIPISVPFVWLLFPFSRRFKLYDHTVFVTYSLCFMMLLLSLGTIIGLVSGAAGLLWFVPPVHMYRQVRGAYGVGRWGAAWRAFALTIFAFIAISLFASLLVALGGLD